ncbi:MAG: bifunctional adenosylcobinamide kinase/adenosylcobinamide-phosphate guanylyltransferase [bacterium]
MGKITFIIGGARSGKSSYAVKLAKDSFKKAAFVATCPYYDEETKERIEQHIKERPSEWQTFEEFRNLAPLLENIDSQHNFDIVIIDCLTLFISNLLLDKAEEAFIKERIAQMLQALKNTKYDSILVANEVGLSIVPENQLARKFRDIAGRVNQLVAQTADHAIFMVAGMPLKLKQ